MKKLVDFLQDGRFKLRNIYIIIVQIHRFSVVTTDSDSFFNTLPHSIFDLQNTMMPAEYITSRL